jgi:hypothetical protein
LAIEVVGCRGFVTEKPAFAPSINIWHLRC